MWSDNIAENDYLGFDVHANLIKGLIDEPNMLPITVGVFGDWGSGKSTIMELVKRAYDQEDTPGTVCLQFNGWTFEGYDDAKAALIEAILKSIKENKSFPRKAKEKAKKLLKSVNWMRVIGFGVKNIAAPLVSASLTGGTSLVPQLLSWLQNIEEDPEKAAQAIKSIDFEDIKAKYLKSTYSDDIEEQYQKIRKFREDFADLLDKANIKKLIVLIDDLDRCLPDRIIDNLEAIKLFLNVKNTAFVIGADPRIVRDAIRHRYRDLISKEDSSNENENKRVVYDYLEKLIQIPYNLPKLSDSEVETYITLLFCEDTLRKDSSTDMKTVLDSFISFRKEDRYSVFGIDKVNDVIKDERQKRLLETKVSLISKLSPLIAGNLNGNPRQIKRFLNTFILRKKLADAAQLSDFKEDVLAKLMILEYAEPAMFTELYGWQVQNKGYAPELKELETTDTNGQHTISEKLKNWDKREMITWLDSEPLLSNVDLRDYFWLSRDSLDSIKSVMTPPIVKTIMSSLLIKDQADNLIKTKIKEGVLSLQENLQHELFLQLSRKASNKADRQQIFNLFEHLIHEGCKCETEFREMCNKYNNSRQPSIKLIVNRIASEYESFKDLIKS